MHYSCFDVHTHCSNTCQDLAELMTNQNIIGPKVGNNGTAELVWRRVCAWVSLMADSKSPGKLTACKAIKDLVLVLGDLRCQNHPPVMPPQKFGFTYMHHKKCLEEFYWFTVYKKIIIRFAKLSIEKSRIPWEANTECDVFACPFSISCFWARLKAMDPIVLMGVLSLSTCASRNLEHT